MRISKTLLALIAVVALLGACGGDDDTSESGDTESVDATSTTAAGGNASATTTEASGGSVRTSVTISQSKFNPAEVAVTKGGAVLWNFADNGVEHTVTAEDDSFDSGKKGSGTFQHTFDEAGTFEYKCEIHSFMKGSVTVT